ncbi:hypothetical protein RND71_007610 [Anisodus tanguticus]|uniref:Uncharacterized protein n=1 Tax=Anisodus tanguticus TaxID=243964 RepID=A0AAE1SM94_9SOLA|nr:hypothetical protein RND71_007610 [Anisodus tanguticus]
MSLDNEAQFEYRTLNISSNVSLHLLLETLKQEERNDPIRHCLKELEENDDNTYVSSQPVEEIVAQYHVNENLVSGALHVSEDAIAAKEQDEGVNKDIVEDTTVQSGNLVPSDCGKGVDESSIEFDESISEIGKGMLNILDNEAEIIADFADTLRVIKNSEGVLSDLGSVSVQSPGKIKKGLGPLA